MYKSRNTMFITVKLCQESSFLSHALNNPQCFGFHTLIAHMVKHILTYLSWGDASISAAGGLSLDLHFWCFLK